MDYEKKYNEALKRARELSKTITGANYEYIFPELKETEDELTWLKNYISEEAYYLSMDIRGDEDSIKLQKLKKSLAWLEKQGKNNMGISEDIKKKLYDKLNKALEKETPESWNEFLDKQGEHEYALKSSNTEDVYRLMEKITKLAEAYEFNLPNRSYDIYAFAKDILAWLEKQGESKPVEWSEDDSVRLQRIIDFLWYNRKGDTDTIYQQEQDIEWLKSLRPQAV